MAKDQDTGTIFINFSKPFDCPGSFIASRIICVKKIETPWPWLSLRGWICFIFVNKRENEREKEKEKVAICLQK